MSEEQICCLCGEAINGNVRFMTLNRVVRAAHHKCWDDFITKKLRNYDRERHLKYRSVWYDDGLLREARKCL